MFQHFRVVFNRVFLCQLFVHIIDGRGPRRGCHPCLHRERELQRVFGATERTHKAIANGFHFVAIVLVQGCPNNTVMLLDGFAHLCRGSGPQRRRALNR